MSWLNVAMIHVKETHFRVILFFVFESLYLCVNCRGIGPMYSYAISQSRGTSDLKGGEGLKGHHTTICTVYTLTCIHPFGRQGKSV